MKNARIIISGGLGFVGQALLHRLIDDGNHIRILDNLTNPSISREAAESMGVEVIVGDITDPAACRDAAEGRDVLVHLAAQTYVAKSVVEPHIDLQINGIGSLNLLEACRDAGVGVVVAASSNAVAGRHPPPFNETALTEPLSPYGCSKLAMESYLHAYAHTHGIRTVALRFANVYGPGSWRKGSVVASFIRSMLSGQGITIHGDGRQTRDFLYIEDIAKAIIGAMDVGPLGSCFCIGSGTRTEIIDLADRLASLAVGTEHANTRIHYEEARIGDIKENWSDIALAQRVLGFQPTIDLDHGLRKTYEWFLEHRGRTGKELRSTVL